MDEFWTPFFIPTTNPRTTIATTTASHISHSQQNMDHPQNVLFSDHTEPPHFSPITPSPPMLYAPPPFIAPYDQNLGAPFMHMNQPSLGGYPMYSVPVQHSNVTIPTYEPRGLIQSREENMQMNEALMAKIARYRRKQARQRVRSNSSTLGLPSIPEGTIRGQPQVTHVFYAPNGKMLTQFLTKKLRNSDVGNVGRIIIPKYVSANKEQNLEEPEDSSSIKETQTHGTDNYSYIHTATNQAIDEEEQASFTLLLNELGHNYRDEEVTNDILTIYNDRGSSS
ncbi:unnamed protein product [Lupinus luteus]|uniref:Uncharacterized protein n=1 Tax=Lupinus luteus TaxID=3873 RepID=A0AAV1YCU9_LUPLU